MFLCNEADELFTEGTSSNHPTSLQTNQLCINIIQSKALPSYVDA